MSSRFLHKIYIYIYILGLSVDKNNRTFVFILNVP